MESPDAAPDPLLSSAFDPEAFRQAGHRLVDRLAGYLQNCRERRLPVLSWEEPDAAARYWTSCLERSEAGQNAPLDQILEEFIERSFHNHHPRNLGHQVGVSLPAAALTTFAAAVIDSGGGVYEVGLAATAMERAVVQSLGRTFGLPEGADGVLTSGGSLGTLHALLAARQLGSAHDAWAAGNSGAETVLASTVSHYCVERSVRMMGLGSQGILPLPSDPFGRVFPEALPRVVDEARKLARDPIALVANACTTATGVFDPLTEIGEFCKKEGIRLHVDAAHGGAAAFSATHRHRLAGIGGADSVVLDLHKMCLTPTVVTALLFARGEDSFRVFTQQADYLWRSEDDQQWFNMARRTVECTQPLFAPRVFAILAGFGPQLIERCVDRTFALAQDFAGLLREQPDFELLLQPESNIVCYRYAPQGLSPVQLDALNSEVRRALVRDGQFYIVETSWSGRRWLRSALMNPCAARSDLEALLDEIRGVARLAVRQA
ncbi:MAG TPA: pyridoxal-dependent decarboxylase [Verrucomicrobiales bacterium]|nr:pyridoxal-dependent decarboxylase [Verrucomicrobiales bacterium]